MFAAQVVLSRVGYVLLQVGDVDSASRAFSAAAKVSAAHGDPSLPPSLAASLLQRNAGLLAFARKDLAAAQVSFLGDVCELSFGGNINASA